MFRKYITGRKALYQKRNQIGELNNLQKYELLA